MGSGNYSTSSYQATRSARQASGQYAFGHTQAVQSGQTAKSAHPDLEVLDNGSLVSRESRDNDDHPVTTPIMVIFDETASMGVVPEILIDKLDTLHGLILGGAYAEGPQICFGAVGDGRTGYEAAPLQVGQFESDNRMDEVLANIYLEHNGGGNGGESYLLPLYFAAHQVQTDHWDKRGEKGYLFICGDEPIHQEITVDEAKRYLGLDLEAPIPAQEVFDAVAERWHVFYLHMAGTDWQSGPGNRRKVEDSWIRYIGENFKQAVQPEATAEVIASLVGMMEGVVDLDAALGNLDNVGSSNLKTSVSNSLATVASGKVSKVVTSAAPAQVASASDGTNRI